MADGTGLTHTSRSDVSSIYCMRTERSPVEIARNGRLGALTVHARGRTNTAPARTAWEQALATECGIRQDLDPAEHARRMQAAMRVRMSRLATAR